VKDSIPVHCVKWHHRFRGNHASFKDQLYCGTRKVWNRCRRLFALIILSKIAEVKICGFICHTILRIWTYVMSANTTYQKNEEVTAWGNLPKTFQNVGSQRWCCITALSASVVILAEATDQRWCWCSSLAYSPNLTLYNHYFSSWAMNWLKICHYKDAVDVQEVSHFSSAERQCFTYNCVSWCPQIWDIIFLSQNILKLPCMWILCCKMMWALKHYYYDCRNFILEYECHQSPVIYMQSESEVHIFNIGIVF
jgi:hypothetical protein